MKNIKRFVLTSFLVLCCPLAQLSTLSQTTPESVQQQTATPTQQLDALVQKTGKPADPGLAVMVIKDGKVKYKKAYGVADLSTGASITIDTPIYIASLGKQFTAVAIMMLAERGRLSYDDKLTRYFPEFESFAPTITIRQLLTHTSGLLDHLDVVKDNVTGWTNNDVVKLLLRENRVLFQPGDKFSYSNSGYVLLSMIVEKVSGESFPAFVQKNIFRPLDMDHTYVAVSNPPKNLKHARGYVEKEGRWELTDYDAFTTGGGGVYSSLDDLYKWDQSFTTERLIKKETLKLASTPPKLNNGRPTPYGFGWMAEFAAKGKLANVWYVASFGNFKGFKGLIKRIPERRFTVIVLTNNGKFPWEIVELAQELYAGEAVSGKQEAGGGRQ
ncbi:MAG TPA: serine hydrolase domain-containing protein [Pyrinomonadaceae bacterium]|nr:serine hydrolase domain-containing protein [Pyrinomonadaceae bacterium]